MSMKHTPGPWAGRDASGKWFDGHSWSVDNDDAHQTEAAVIHANGKVVAIVVSTEWDSQELLANGDLIAAAPDLLKALRAVVSVADRATVEFDMARAAIAKATGGNA